MAEKLSLPVRFLAPEDLWPPPPPDGYARIDQQHILENNSGGAQSWIIQAEYFLRCFGHECHLATEAHPDYVNISHPDILGLKARPADCFILLCRADRPYQHSADFLFEQFPETGQHPRSAFVHNWPQPGLIPRDSGRGTEVRTISFKGHPLNLEPWLKDERFLRDMEQRGISFEDASGVGVEARKAWADYSQTDILVAVRNLTRYNARNKPANKLTNAWLAGVPAILGPEPAFQTLRRSDLDYIEVSTYAEALRAIDRLIEQPDLYERMVRNGLERAPAYTQESMVARWVELLNGPVRTAFEQWRRRNPTLRRLSRWARLGLDQVERRIWQYRIRNGPRILDPET